jgi:hypothetical protein
MLASTEKREELEGDATSPTCLPPPHKPGPRFERNRLAEGRARNRVVEELPREKKNKWLGVREFV